MTHAELGDGAWLIWAFAFAAFVLGGFVKGALGVGLPLVVVPLLTLMLSPYRAIGMVVVPVIFSNAWQVWEAGVSRKEVRRFSPLIVMLVITTLLTVGFTLSLSERDVARMLAAAVLVAVALMAWQPELRVSPRREGWVGAGVGALSGLLGGVSSLTGPLIISYLMALRLPREVFVGAISVIYLCAAIPLYGMMLLNHPIGPAEILISAAALVPVWAGLRIGRWCRQRMSEAAFRRMLLGFLALIAVALLLK